jgi:tetratricopeptide (TPR) repeat protein
MFIRSGNDEVGNSLKRVNALEEKGKLSDAIKELEKTIKVKPNDGQLYNRLGDLFIKQNATDKAIRAFTQGAKAYREEHFDRNAIALCKKILRYDPGNIDMYQQIADLLVELDEKSDALIYYFEYVEKQLAAANNAEVEKALKKIESLGTIEGKSIKKMHDAYVAIGRQDLAKKFLDVVMEDEIVLEEIKEPETVQDSILEPIAEETKPEPAPRVHVDTNIQKLEAHLARIDKAVRDVGTTAAELGKAMRLDDVIRALDKSMTSMSGEQKKAIALLQASLGRNIEAFQKSIAELRSGSDANAHDLKQQLENLSKALGSLSKNQASFIDRVNNNIDKVGASFSAATKTAVAEVQGILATYKKASDEQTAMLLHNKESSDAVVKITDELKRSVVKMSDSLSGVNDSLTRFFLVQESREKKQSRYTYITLGLIAAICAALIVSLFI